MLVCFHHLHARLRVQWAPGVSCALCSLEGRRFPKLGQIVPRERGCLSQLATSLRGANGSRECAPDDRLRDEAIHSFFARRNGLRRFARNDGSQLTWLFEIRI
jgi:hypothetical protein